MTDPATMEKSASSATNSETTKGVLDYIFDLPFLISFFSFSFLVFLVLIFRRPLGNFISNSGKFKGKIRTPGGVELFFELARQRPNNSLPISGETVITKADVIEAFNRVEDLSDEQVSSSSSEALRWLLRNGVITKSQLQGLVDSKDVLKTLRNLYVTELERNPDKPLDPMALATWGAALFFYGVKQETIHAIRNGIRQSPEYKNKFQGRVNDKV